MPLKQRSRLKRPNFLEPWEGGWSRAKYRRLLQQPGFPSLVALARLMNMMQFSIAATLGFEDRTAGRYTGRTPAMNRQMLNAFFVTNSLLHEALVNVVPRLGQYYRAHHRFAALGRLRRNRTWKCLIEDNYKVLRN